MSNANTSKSTLPSKTLSPRDISLDWLKAILLIGMVIGHVVKVTSAETTEMAHLIFGGIDFITFSGFYFCFGQTSYMAYLSRDIDRRRILRNSIRILLGYYISAFFVTFTLDGFSYPKEYIAILIFMYVAPYSEFLLSFAALNLLIYLLLPQLRRLSGISMLLLSLLSLAMTFFPYEIMPKWLNVLGIFVGTRQFLAFPVVQYMPIFFLGMYMRKTPESTSRRISLSVIYALSFALFIYAISVDWDMANRFPPNWIWITSTAFSAMSIYWAATKLTSICHSQTVNRIVIYFGKYTLSSLVISNIVIFGTIMVFPQGINPTAQLIVVLITLSICLMHAHIQECLRRKRANFDKSYIFLSRPDRD